MNVTCLMKFCSAIYQITLDVGEMSHQLRHVCPQTGFLIKFCLTTTVSRENFSVNQLPVLKSTSGSRNKD